MRIVVTGRTGQVVTALAEKAFDAGIELVALGRPELDLTDAASVRRTIEGARPDVIVSAAAYTDVDGAEAEPELAFAINAAGPASLARTAGSLGVPIIHLSTDYVFSGDKATPYAETDRPGPISVYGRSKLAGEQRVADATPRHVILRTAWIYSPFRSNFLKTMLRLAEGQNSVRVVADQFGQPTSALDIATAVLTVGQRLVVDPDRSLRGVFHVTGRADATWADFAEAIFHGLRTRTGKVVAVERIGTADYPTRAKRPANSRLSSEKLRDVYGVVLPDWRHSTEMVLDRLLGNSGVSR